MMAKQSVVLDFFECWKSTGTMNRDFFAGDFVFEGPLPKVDLVFG